MRHSRTNNKPSGLFLVREKLRNTPSCRCGSTKPALVTKSVGGKVKGFCTECIS